MCLPILALLSIPGRDGCVYISWTIFPNVNRKYHYVEMRQKEWIRELWRSVFFRTLVRLQCEVQNAFLIVRFCWWWVLVVVTAASAAVVVAAVTKAVMLMPICCCCSAVFHALKFHFVIYRWSMHTIQPPLVMRHFVRKVCSHNFRNKIAFTSVLIQLNYFATSIKIVRLDWVNAETWRGNCYAL